MFAEEAGGPGADADDPLYGALVGAHKDAPGWMAAGTGFSAIGIRRASLPKLNGLGVDRRRGACLYAGVLVFEAVLVVVVMLIVVSLIAIAVTVFRRR